MLRPRLLALVMMAAFALPACDPDDFRDFFAGFAPLDFSTSTEPEVQAMGTALAQEDKQQAAFEEYDEFIVSGKDTDFEAALQNQPDPQFYADRLAGELARHGSESLEYARAKTALLRAQASKLGPDTTPATLERNVLRRLEGSLTRLMDAQFPGWRDAPPVAGDPAYDTFSELCETTGALEQYSVDPQISQCAGFQSQA